MQMNEKIVVINGTDSGSTGTIALEIANYVSSNIQTDYVLFTSDKKTKEKRVIQINDGLSKKINRFLVKVDGSDGFRNNQSTKKLIQHIKNIKPALIHIHNIHGYFLNMPMLMAFIESTNIPLVWTLHDNWLFTGRCATIPRDCDGLKTNCEKCKFKKLYPWTFFDFSKKFFKKKLNALSLISNVTFVSPSQWNKTIAEQSLIMKNKKIIVINNGIDLNVFNYKNVTHLREKYYLENKFIVFCAAFAWSEEKGLSYVNEIAEKLDKNKFAVIMAGATKNIKTSKNVIRLPIITSSNKMAELYSLANVFLTPTLCDNYPTVDMESLACGTPVVTFDTGGAKEIVNANVGRVVKQGDIEGLYNAIIDLYNNPIDRDYCRQYAMRFSKTLMLDKYLELYKELIGRKNNG